MPLVKNAFRLLLDQLKPDDTVGIVTYASGSGIALEPTRVADKGKILSAIDSLGAGGSTAGAAGLADAYRLAEPVSTRAPSTASSSRPTATLTSVSPIREELKTSSSANARAASSCRSSVSARATTMTR